MSKTITLRCSRSMCELLRDILRRYADAAYPAGGSECSQSSRQSLLTSADRLLENWDSGPQSTVMSRRLRVMAKAAVKYYAQTVSADEDESTAHRQDYLLSVFGGEAIDDVGYHAARDRDLAD